MPKNDDSKQTKSNTHRLYVDIPHATLKKLLLWAASRGETKNGQARFVIVIRCEENYPKIQTWLNNEAANLGVSPEDLEQSLLERMGFDFEAYRLEMLGKK